MAFEGLSQKLKETFTRLKRRGKLSEQDIKETMREVRLALLEADVSYKVAKDFVAAVSERAVGAEVQQSLTPAQQVIKIVNEELIKLMGSESARVNFPKKPPCVIMMCGLQGSGKTTHCAKLGYMFKKDGRRPLLVACDIYRPAAIEQLQTVGAGAQIPVFEMGKSDPVKIAREAVKHAKDHGNDVVILDTAGRLHIDEELMKELENIKKAVEVNETLLVVDAMTGQDAVNVAQSFNDRLDIDGVILTKLDGDTRGGAAISVKAITGKPIKFAGVGERTEDLEVFHPDRMASRILGMGDVLTFIEKAGEQVDEEKALAMAKKLKKQGLDMNDMLEQIERVSSMGSLEQLIAMMPGGMGRQLGDINADDARLKRTAAIIKSMTPQEREKPDIIKPSRKRRIAAGSGTRVEDVNLLLKQLRQTNEMMKSFNKNPKAFQRGLGGRLPM